MKEDFLGTENMVYIILERDEAGQLIVYSVNATFEMLQQCYELAKGMSHGRFAACFYDKRINQILYVTPLMIDFNDFYLRLATQFPV